MTLIPNILCNEFKILAKICQIIRNYFFIFISTGHIIVKQNTYFAPGNEILNVKFFGSEITLYGKNWNICLTSLSQANTEKPEWSEEEQQVRDEVLNNLSGAGGFEEAGLKKQIMVDRSAPVVGGQ